MSNSDGNGSDNGGNLAPGIHLPPGAKAVPAGPFVAADSFNNVARMKAAAPSAVGAQPAKQAAPPLQKPAGDLVKKS